MRTALVRGPEPRIVEISAALRRDGFHTIASPSAKPHPVLPPRSLYCYVGIPAGPVSGSSGAVRTVLTTLEGLTSATPLLAPDATVLLITNPRGADPTFNAAVRLLATTAVADHGHIRVEVRSEPCTPSDIASAVSRQPSGLRGIPPTSPAAPDRTASLMSPADLAPDLGYADWRNEVLNLAGEREGTYFGWLNHKGEPAVGVLRGAVLTPLPPVTTDGVLAWGQHGEGTQLLAGAMLCDLLGPDARCPLCRAAVLDCRGCHGTGLAESMRDLADSLTKEVLSSLPDDGFELPTSSVRGWIEQVRSARGAPRPHRR